MRIYDAANAIICVKLKRNLNIHLIEKEAVKFFYSSLAHIKADKPIILYVDFYPSLCRDSGENTCTVIPLLVSLTNPSDKVASSFRGYGDDVPILPLNSNKLDTFVFS